MRDVEIAMQLEEIQTTEAWRVLDRWLMNKETQARKDLVGQKFIDLAEVHVLQARVQLIEEFRAEIKNRIDKGIKARQKQEKE